VFIVLEYEEFFGLCREDAQDKDDWRIMETTGKPPSLPEKWLLEWCV